MRIKLYTDKRLDRSGKKPVRLSISFLGHRHLTTLGCSMTDDEFDTFLKCINGEKTKNKTAHPQQDELQRLLHNISDKLEWEIEKVKRGEISDEAIDIAKIVNDCKGIKRNPTQNTTSVEQLYLRFVEDERKRKDLQTGTINQIMGLYRDLNRSYPNLSIERASKRDWIQEYLDMLVKRGYNSNSIRSKYRYLHWFLKWAYRNDLCDDDFERYKFKLKVVSNRERLVVFLTIDELLAIKNHNTEPASVLCKDIFLFQCFTGLRYSDVIRIKNTDIRDGTLTILTQKNGMLLTNKLNNYAIEIASKYHNKFGDTLFPYVSDGTINVHIRKICREVGIDEIVTKYEYRNHQRMEITGPKWMFVSTHVGRKSFVVNSLDFGLTATQVVAYTGHSTIQAMQPYISISQKKKDDAMNVWNDVERLSKNNDDVNGLKAQIEGLKRRLESLEKPDGV